MTAVALTSLFPPFMDSKEDISIVDYLWGTLFYIAKQLSPSDDYQARFIFLVLEIRKMPAPPGEGRLAFEEGLSFQNFWIDLAVWCGVRSDYEKDAPLVPRILEFPMSGTPMSKGPSWSMACSHVRR
jgi:hypothetical protein